MNECYFTQFNGVIADLKREVNNLAVIFKGKTQLRDIGDMTQPIDDVHNNGVHNNGDGVDSECDGHSTLPLCQPNCLAATPTSPMRVGSSRRVTANPTAYQLVDPTTHHISDTTQPALKKQRLVNCPEGGLWFLLGGDDIFSNNEAATSFDKNPTTLGDLLVLNALDDDVLPIAFEQVAGALVIGKTSTALDDSSERGHTRYQVKEHTAHVGALLASRTSGQLSGGYDQDSGVEIC
jgi:hypothetical protein